MAHRRTSTARSRAVRSDVVQPDVCNVGGLTPAREVATRARRAGVPLWGTPVALAGSLQLLATLPAAAPLEFDHSPNPLREELATDPFEPDDEGRVAVPDGPGLGVDLDPDGRTVSGRRVKWTQEVLRS